MAHKKFGRIVAVVVTYNRAELLQACLDGLAAQSYPLAGVVVIDNASTDESGKVARNHPIGADVLTLENNHGGAGGFAAGIARAMAHHDPDWLWLMDDDTVPLPQAVAGLAHAYESFPYPVDVLSSTAVWVDGRIHPMNVSRNRVGAPQHLVREAARIDSNVIRTASFVAFAVSAEAVRRHGLPWADYFIWGDDTEYSARVLKTGTGLQVGGSVVEHRTARYGSWQSDPGPRFFYDVRNKCWLFIRTRSFLWWERILYGGSAALGWLKTLGRSENRTTLLKNGARGLWAALTTAPRPTEKVLGSEAPIAAAIASLRSQRPSAADTKKLSAPLGTPPAEPQVVPLSVLLPVYRGSNLADFQIALDSITVDQVGMKPSEVVIVEDGPVSPDLSERIAALEAHGIADPTLPTPINVTVVRLAQNRGLTVALNAGLDAATYDLVARMDADDLSTPQRLWEQVHMMQSGLDLVGSAIQEWDGRDGLGELRRRPETGEKIAQYAAFHNPFHHPSVLYRKSAVKAVGGYQEMPYMEDYWLFVRMIAAGARVGNSPHVLVKYRVDQALFERRGGWEAFRSDLRFQAGLYELGLTNRLQYTRNMLQRAAYRAVPARVRQVAYRLLVNRG